MSGYGIPPDLPKSKTSFSPCHYRHFCYICKNHSTHETPQNRGFVSFGSSTFCNVMRCSTARTQPAPSSASQGGSASPPRTPQTAEAPQKAEKAQRAAGTSALRLRQPPIIRGHAQNTIPFGPLNIDGPEGILCLVKARYYRRADKPASSLGITKLKRSQKPPVTP